MIISRTIGLLGLLSGAYAYKALSDDGLRNIADPGDDFDIKQGALLAPILQPRVPGTPGGGIWHHRPCRRATCPDSVAVARADRCAGVGWHRAPLPS